MLNLLFSPNGRLNPSEFTKAALVLIGLGALFSLPDVLGMTGAIPAITGILSLALIIPWVFVWIKRYHDGDKPGVLCLVPIAAYVVLFIIAVIFMIGGELMTIVEMSTDGASQAEQNEYLEAQLAGKVVPFFIAGIAISAIIAFGFNAMIKHDPNDNQYGPAH